MGIRSVEEYKQSLRDGRRVYIRGEKVDDVTRHPVLGVTVDTVAQGFALTSHSDPELRNLFTAPHPATGEPVNRFFVTPRNADDLAHRTRMIQRSIELTGGLPFGKDIGTDCLNAAFVVADMMGNKQAAERGSATEMEVKDAKLEVQIAEFSLKKAEFEHEQSIRKYDEAKIRFNNLILKSPIAGRVEKIEVKVGESIDGLVKVLRLSRQIHYG